jgi:hypothetical protein
LGKVRGKLIYERTGAIWILISKKKLRFLLRYTMHHVDQVDASEELYLAKLTSKKRIFWLHHHLKKTAQHMVQPMRSVMLRDIQKPRRHPIQMLYAAFAFIALAVHQADGRRKEATTKKRATTSAEDKRSTRYISESGVRYRQTALRGPIGYGRRITV